MAGTPTFGMSLAETSPTAGRTGDFVAVTTLFFAWGFITSTIDPLVTAVRTLFSLSYTESMLTQFAFFTAYGIVSLPGAIIVARLRYGGAIVASLLAMLAGALFIPVATGLDTYGLVLAALFVVGAGITVLQVAANPLAAALGPPEGSHFRLTLSQAFNSLGTVLGPIMASTVMLRGGVFGDHAGSAERAQSFGNVDTAFLGMAAMILVLALFMGRVRKRLDRAAPVGGSGASVWTALGSRWALLGAAAIFLYVGAEVSIGSSMINFLSQRDVLGIPVDRAGQLLGVFYWGGAMVGRFAGSMVLRRVPAPLALTVVASVATLLCLTVTQAAGGVAAVAALAVGTMNAIMFPTIFTVTLERSTAPTAATSGLLCMAIVGGAVLPVMFGRIADLADLHAAFFVPMTAYAVISLIAFAARRAPIAAVPESA
ncbi:MAG TPA: glucose/galactose MFS transporter [Stellaceae bacterium]|nr:glucose/galactose MFS transporter [Stellaceae bacterium]